MKYSILDLEEAKNVTGWTTHMDAKYIGVIPGLLCGYNFEAIKDGKVDWCSTTYKPFTPDELMDGEHGWYADFLSDCRCTPTGRVIFRGYFTEEYDPDERETYVKEVDMNTIIDKYMIKE